MDTYEVTVPLVVTVKESRSGQVEVVSAEINRGWPGCFSECEENGGVWFPADEAWMSHAAVQRAAWDFTWKALAAHKLMSERLKEVR